MSAGFFFIDRSATALFQSTALPKSLNVQQKAYLANAAPTATSLYPVELEAVRFNPAPGQTDRMVIRYAADPSTVEIKPVGTFVSYDVKWWASWYGKLFSQVGDYLKGFGLAADLLNGNSLTKAIAKTVADQWLVESLTTNPKLYDGQTAAYLYKASQALKSLADYGLKFAATGSTAAEIQFGLAVSMAKVAVASVNYVLNELAKDPPSFDYQNVIRYLGAVDLSALRSALGNGVFGDATITMLESAMKALEAAVVAYAGAERGQAAFADDDSLAFVNQAGAFYGGLDALRSATNLFGDALAQWLSGTAALGLQIPDEFDLDLDYSRLSLEDLALIRSDLLRLGLFDAAYLDQVIVPNWDSTSERVTGSHSVITELAVKLSAAPAVDTAAVDTPGTLALLALGLAFMAVARQSGGRLFPLH